MNAVINEQEEPYKNYLETKVGLPDEQYPHGKTVRDYILEQIQ